MTFWGTGSRGCDSRRWPGGFQVEQRVTHGRPGCRRCRAPRPTPWGQKTGSTGPAKVQGECGLGVPHAFGDQSAERGGARPVGGLWGAAWAVMALLCAGQTPGLDSAPRTGGSQLRKELRPGPR